MSEHIALFGITGNPIHNNHIMVATRVIESIPFLTKLLIVPCPDNSHKVGLVPASYRIKMAKLAAKGLNKIDVDDFEIQEKLSGRTIDTIKFLKSNSETKNNKYSYVIGIDNALHINKWHCWGELIREFSFIVVDRGGFEYTSKQWFDVSPHLHLTFDNSPMSSTWIRERLGNGDFDAVAPHLNSNVLDYIKLHKLYQ